ncbi:MAG: hypothetical protein S4CHLAM81_14130 [Chlamydiales bacterium]|nr:hypothetical protein [Chlamydiales bacterium]MCH9636185.1 hypothetical protein [Chlamydiales bacterium]MCH9704225.1 hypothetical protein [Chlamydiota bacterium]
MQLHRRARYNMMHLPGADEPLEQWQKQDYRALDDGELFMQLQEAGLTIPTVELFEQMAEEFDSPDEMADTLAADNDYAYLLLFELWRRHLPQQRCPSVFCDELDFQILHFEQGDLQYEEELQEIVDYLEQIFDDHVDEGADPQAVYQAFQQHCAHNLDQFLYQYIATQIDSGNIEYAYDLVEGFYPYISEPLFFDFLLARVAILQNPQEGTAYLEQLIRKVKSLELAEEILLYLVESSNHPLFCQMAQATLPLLPDEGSFREFLDLAAIHFERMGFDPTPWQELSKKRSKRAEATAIKSDDPDIPEVKKWLKEMVKK